MDQAKSLKKRGVHPIVSFIALLLCAPLSAFFLAEGYSFLHFFDLLGREARISAPVIMLCCLGAFCVLQAVCAAFTAELWVGRKNSILSILSALLSLGAGFVLIFTLCDKVLLGPAILCCSFLPCGLLMGVSYEKGRSKASAILWALGGAVVVLALALLVSGVEYDGGFTLFFEGLIERIQNSFQILVDDMMAELLLFAGDEEKLAHLLSSGTIPSAKEGAPTVAAFLESYRQNMLDGLTSLLLLIPSLLFTVCTASLYGAYGLLRLLRISAGDREKRPLMLSVLAAGAYGAGMLVHTVWSVFFGGGGAFILLVINLIVMLTLPLAVIGVKCVRSLIGQVFANNKIMGVLCIAIILMSPFTMLALSGCYAIFADYLRAYFEKKRSERQ